MANTTTIVLMKASPLTGIQDGVLYADIVGQENFQPAFVLETDPTSALTVSSTGLAADTDIWRIVCAPSGPMADYRFVCLQLRLILSDTGANAAFTTMWEDEAAYAMSTCDSSSDAVAWDYTTLQPVMNVIDTGGERLQRALAPDMRGFPPQPSAATSDTILENALGGFQLKVATWDATSAAATNMFVSARFLAFRAPATRNAGYYAPYRYFSPK